MKKEKHNSQQIPLDAIRIRKTGVSAADIKKIKYQLYRRGSEILTFTKKPSRKGGEKK